jgi:hypothetical protein
MPRAAGPALPLRKGIRTSRTPAATVPQAAALLSSVRMLEKNMRIRISTSSKAVLTA